MDQSTFNHGKSGDTNPKGRSRSPLLELYTRSLRNEREEKIGHRTSAACGGRLRLCYTLDEGKESERETTNCPPKRVRSKLLHLGRYLHSCRTRLKSCERKACRVLARWFLFKSIRENPYYSIHLMSPEFALCGHSE